MGYVKIILRIGVLNMKVFVADEAKVENYLLSEKIEDTFLINYESKDGILENIIISANNGKAYGGKTFLASVYRTFYYGYSNTFQ